MTEIYDYLRLLYARTGRPHCPICGRPIAGQSVDSIVDQILRLEEGTRFTVNGADAVVGRGQATVFPMGDRHGLRVAEGDGVSFLEFHIPAAYTTVRG